jgi:solute carrier family 8 (sodium/calcium exchanger)
VNVFLGLGMPWLIAAIYWSDPSAEDKGKWLAKYCGPFPSKVPQPHLKSSFDFLLYVQVESALSACPTSFAGDIGFAVPAGDLGTSVGVFVGGACAAVVVLLVRRAKYAAELGGPETPKKVTAVFFIFLWLVYVGVSVYLAYK